MSFVINNGQQFVSNLPSTSSPSCLILEYTDTSPHAQFRLWN